MRKLIENKDYAAIRQMLSSNPALANEGFPCDEKNPAKAHPLHRICDAVFSQKITDEEAIEIAKIFLEFGAKIDGDKGKDNHETPLVAAASLHAEQLGIFYIENGADIYHSGCSGGSALHWAAYCGRDKLVERLIEEKAVIDQLDTSHNATPLSWAIYSLMTGNEMNKYHQVNCIKLLLRAGADKSKLQKEMIEYLHFLGKDDLELEKMLN